MLAAALLPNKTLRLLQYDDQVARCTWPTFTFGNPFVAYHRKITKAVQADACRWAAKQTTRSIQGQCNRASICTKLPGKEADTMWPLAAGNCVISKQLEMQARTIMTAKQRVWCLVFYLGNKTSGLANKERPSQLHRSIESMQGLWSCEVKVHLFTAKAAETLLQILHGYAVRNTAVNFPISKWP